MADGVDCLSVVTPTLLAELHRTGRVFVLRYIGSKGTESLSTAEAHAIRAAGFDLGLIYETFGQAALQGASSGGRYGRDAAGYVKTLGAPEGTAVYIAETDFDVQPQDVSAVRAFYSAAAQVLALSGYRLGVYGGFRAMQAVAGIDALRWQTYAWSYGQWVGGVQLQQYGNGVQIGGVTVDLDRSLSNQWGQWPAHIEPHITTEEERMDWLIVATTDDAGQSTGSYIVHGPSGATGGLSGDNAPTVPHVSMPASQYNQLVSGLQAGAKTGA